MKFSPDSNHFTTMGTGLYMPGKRDNLLESHHLLVLRQDGGFGWQIRYGRHANSVEQSSGVFVTQAEAQASGQDALNRHEAAALKGE